MRVNNNMLAVNTHRNLILTTMNSSKSVEKLSSGFRVNGAADDAAGLSISEKMRAQIRGLNRAATNSQDAISLIQTAEGALNETHAILQRMRVLAVQAANDTNVAIDRGEIQKEIEALTNEVDRIANQTEFNTKKLLNGDFAITNQNIELTDEQKMVINLKKWWLEEAEALVIDSYGLQAPNVNMEVVVFNDPMNSAAALVKASFTSDLGNTTGTPDITGKGMNLKLEINMAFSTPVDSNGGSFPQYVDRVIAHEMVHASMMTTMNFGDLPIWFNEGTAEFIHGADERLKFAIANLGGGAAPAQLDAGVAAVVAEAGTGLYSDWNSSSEDYAAAYLAVRYLDHQIRGTTAGGELGGGTASDSTGIKVIMDYLTANDTHNLDQALANLNGLNLISFNSTASWISSFSTHITNMATLTSQAGVVLNTGIVGSSFEAEIDTGSYLGGDVTGDLLSNKTAESILPQAEGENSPEVEQPLIGFSLQWPDEHQRPAPILDWDKALRIQVGANANQSMAVSLSDMRAQALGLRVGSQNNALSLVSHEAAEEALVAIDSAIRLVSEERGKLGAYTNRLESTINNLRNTAENMQASESKIRDVDMAKEIMQFTKFNILQQTSQVMLSQANQGPQGVLQLLR